MISSIFFKETEAPTSKFVTGLIIVTIVGLAFPLAGNFLAEMFLSHWRSEYQNLHTAIEVVGGCAAISLGIFFNLSSRNQYTSRHFQSWISYGLMATGILGLFHATSPIGDLFSWLQSLSTLLGGFFFSMVWWDDFFYNDSKTPPGKHVIFLLSGAFILIGALSVFFGNQLPDMMMTSVVRGSEEAFTRTAKVINIIGGSLFFVSSLFFIKRFYQTKRSDDLIFIFLCFVFGLSGVMAKWTAIWSFSWWNWHVLRLMGYLLLFVYLFRKYWLTAAELTHAHNEMFQMYNTSVDGKRIIDLDFNVVKVNKAFAKMAGMSEEALLCKKCYESFTGPTCHTLQCPVRRIMAGADLVQLEVEKQAIDGSSYYCLLNAAPLHDHEGNLVGVVESMKDITERKQVEEQLKLQAKLKTAQSELHEKIRSEHEYETLGKLVISYLCDFIGAQVGVIYIMEDEVLRFAASHAIIKNEKLPDTFRLGEGLVGQAALDGQRRIIDDAPDNYLPISSGLGVSMSSHILIKPFIHNGNVKGVVEFGGFSPFTKEGLEFIDMVSEGLAVTIEVAQSHHNTQKLLSRTQALAEKLQNQQEELRVANEEMQEQTERLHKSESQLQAQQEELRVANEELEEKTQLLENEKKNVQQQNRELREAQEELKKRTRELERSNHYKSEFLANMSHELRTPLNSMLILSNLLAQNKSGNLDEKEISDAQVIHSAGVTLFELINDILDLSKIEAGKVEIEGERFLLRSMIEDLKNQFASIANEKKIEFEVTVDELVPETIISDRQRLKQIITNLLSNAFKFTARGKVTLTVGKPIGKPSYVNNSLHSDSVIAFEVKDSGIGIQKDKLQLIFDEFQQVDGTISRKYGGTGLGLSISRRLSTLLGGEIHVTSEYGSGSLFTLFIPEDILAQEERIDVLEPVVPSLSSSQSPPASAAPPPEPEIVVEKSESEKNKFENVERKKVRKSAVIEDDRKSITDNDKVVLIVEDDFNFAKILRDMAHEKGFKAVVAGSGDEGLAQAIELSPLGIILDIQLPTIDGFTVMNKLKDNPLTRHIPVHFISVTDKVMQGLQMGAIGFFEKPVTVDQLHKVFDRIQRVNDQHAKELLIVEDNQQEGVAIKKLLAGKDLNITLVESGEKAWRKLNEKRYDCMVLDLRLADMTGFELLKMIRETDDLYHLPVVIHTGKELTDEERLKLKDYSDSIVMKGAQSPEILFDQTALFLHRVESNLPEEKRKIIRMVHDDEEIFKSRKILIVDDDMRNVFALQRILEEKGVGVIAADNGAKSLVRLDENPDVDLVIMDIMMPVMDGYEAIAKIRSKPKYKHLPIIALTAKAMAEDRAKCIKAGATDYLSKPVNIDQLLSLMRVWLYQSF